VLWALTYTVTLRLAVDGGIELGLTSGGPHLHAFVGATYAIANLYSVRRQKPSGTSSLNLKNQIKKAAD